jgi:hypothetical protein
MEIKLPSLRAPERECTLVTAGGGVGMAWAAIPSFARHPVLVIPCSMLPLCLPIPSRWATIMAPLRVARVKREVTTVPVRCTIHCVVVVSSSGRGRGPGIAAM